MPRVSDYNFAILGINAKDLEAFTLHYYDLLSLSEIGRIQGGVTKERTKQRVYKVLAILKANGFPAPRKCVQPKGKPRVIGLDPVVLDAVGSSGFGRDRVYGGHDVRIPDGLRSED